MVKMRQRHICVFEFEQGSVDEILAYIQYNADFMKDRLLAFNVDITPDIQDFLHSLVSISFKVENKKLLQQGKVKELFTDNFSTQQDTLQTPATQKIKITLDSSDLTHVVMESIADNKIDSIESTLHSNNVNQDSLISQMENTELLVDTNSLYTKAMRMETFRRTIRSGEEITLESHAIFTKDIHAGAFIKSYGNLHVYGKCNGVLECLGDYIIIGEFAMGRISLQNIDLEGKMLEAVKNSKKLKMLTIENGVISLCEL